MQKNILPAIALAWAALVIPASGQSSEAATAQLARTDALTRLDDPALKPWYMKVQFELAARKEQKPESGTLEEWWAGPSQYKWTVTSPSYNATYVVNARGKFRTKGTKQLPYLLEVLQRQMVHPMPTAKEVQELRPVFIKPEGGVPLDCIMYSRAVPNIDTNPLGLFPSYCVDKGRDTLEVSYDYATLAVARVAMGMFQKRVMPIDLKVMLDRKNAVSSHLLMLKTITAQESDFAESAEMDPDTVERKYLPYTDVMKTIVSHPYIGAPLTVPVVKRGQAVIVRVLIGTDGHIHGERLMWTPDARLAGPTLAAMIDWRYETQHEKGKAVEAETDAGLIYNETPQ